jgi:peptidoglycan/xylan/chitin deacetylase (PgdA/CDA1 family)
MRVTSLCYHDVITGSAFNTSGFPGEESAGYKLDTVAFRQHLEAIEDQVMEHSSARRPGHVMELLGGLGRKQGCLLTFDDGGTSAITTIAPMLEDFGWRGHFFITTDYIDAPGFLTRDEIRQLHRRGHVIGSLSSSHRGRMSSLPPERLVNEWGVSKEILSGLLGEEVLTAAVPSGYYAPRVAEAAAVVGLKALFTLEPRTLTESRGGCLVLGRYLVKRGTPASLAAKLAVGSPYQCARQWLLWNTRKVAENGLGDVYPKVRRACFSRQRSAH